MTRALRFTLTCLAAMSPVIGGAACGGDAPARVGGAGGEPPSNGPIVASGDLTAWEHDSRPPRLTRGAPYPPWNAFDQDAGAFLYISYAERVFVVGEDGPIADFDCQPLPALCETFTNELSTESYLGGLAALGPGPDEVTLPAGVFDRPVRSLRVVGFDGTVRDELDLAPAVTESAGQDPGRLLTDLAWSPDGNRLAVSTTINACCSTRAAPKIWIFDRRGGKPRVLYSGRRWYENGNGEFHDLAWAADGRSLGMTLTPGVVHFPRSDYPTAAWPPRLIVLRLPPGQPMRADTLHVYDDCDCPGSGLQWAAQFGRFFDFAWSPDGTRIAVTGNRRISEISAGDGRVLARHPRNEVAGPLAWPRGRPG